MQRSGIAKHRIYTTSVASVYPHYVAKAEIRYLDKLIESSLGGKPMDSCVCPR